jgi:hypothetical protein
MRLFLHWSKQFEQKHSHPDQSASFQQQLALLKTSILGSLAVMVGLVAPGSAIPADSIGNPKAVIPTQLDAVTKVRVLEAYGKLPLNFEANQGQTDQQVKFLARGSGYSVFLTPTEAVLSLRQPQTQPSTQSIHSVVKLQPTAKSETTVLHLQLIGSNPIAQVKGIQKLPSKSNYLIGKDSNQWHTNIAHYAKVQYKAVYPGIDLVYYGNQRQLEYDFVVAPGANPQNIRFQVKGASRLSIDRQGNLLLHTPSGIVRQHQPRIYQEINGQRKAIAGSYILLGKQQVGFQVAVYDPSQPLVIDPVLSYSTYLGGNDTDSGSGIAVDRRGNIYVTGFTTSTDFPTKNALDSTLGGNLDAFVTKLNSTAAGDTSVVYSTYLGGNGEENGNGIAVDNRGNVYVTGITRSGDFPTTENAFARTLGGPSDAFVSKLSAAGNSLLYSTYLGGSSGNGNDFGNGIAVNNRGNVYVTGETYSTDFPIQNAYDSQLDGLNDGFVTKLNPAASGAASLIYSTYLGGSGFDSSFGIAVDSRGNAYTTGLTFSGDFPTKNGFEQTLGGNQDAFVTKVDPAASGDRSLAYSTYLGGGSDEFGRGIAVDLRGNAYVTGRTSSTDFPTQNAFDSSLEGSQDAFVTKLNPAASGARSLVYSTYLGGSGNGDEGYGIAVDVGDNAYIIGSTNSTNFPIKNAFDSTLSGINDAFVTKLNVTGNSLVYSTYLGGSNFDNGYGIAVDLRGNAYVVGNTTSTDFPIKNAFDSTLDGGSDGFVTKIESQP